MFNFKYLLRPWFVLLLILEITHQLTDKILQIRLPILDNYLDPLLLIPILLQLMLWERNTFWKQEKAFVFSKLQLVAIFFIVCVITEYFYPIWKSSFTADIWDVVCYGIGTLIFGLFWNKPMPYKK